MKFRLTFLLLIIFYNITYSQDSLLISKDEFKTKLTGFLNAWEKLQKGNSYYNQSKYSDAIFFYETAIRYNSENAILNYRLGNCYFENNRSTKAIDYFLKSYQLSPNLYDDLEFKIGRSYQLNYQFDEAIIYFKSYFKRSKSPEIGIERSKYISECIKAKDLIKNPVRVKIKNLGNLINTENDEYMPVFCFKDSSLFYNSKQTISGKKREKIYYSKLINNNWTQSQIFDSSLFVNKFTNYGISYVSKDMRQMLIVGCGDKKYNGKCHLYNLVRDVNGWSEPEIFDTIITDYKETYAKYSANFDSLYFTRIDKSGNSDIYFSYKNQTNWTEPIKLNSSINTSSNEYILFLSNDTLYFASDGLADMGGFDIYMTIKDKNNMWSTPINMGYPINTPYDEFGFYKTETLIYISSNRNLTFGLSDIFEIEYLK